MALTESKTTNGDILSDTFNSVLKLHASGGLSFMDGHLLFRGDIGSYWSSSQADQKNSKHLFVSEEERDLFDLNKAHGFPVRCILD